MITVTRRLMISEWLNTDKFPDFVQKRFISGYSAVKVPEMRSAAQDDYFIDIIYSLNGSYLKFFGGLEEFCIVCGPVRSNGLLH